MFTSISSGLRFQFHHYVSDKRFWTKVVVTFNGNKVGEFTTRCSPKDQIDKFYGKEIVFFRALNFLNNCCEYYTFPLNGLFNEFYNAHTNKLI